MARRNHTQASKSGPGFEAAIDQDTVYKMEESASSQSRGQQRRLVLLQLSQDSASMIEFARNEPEAFEEVSHRVLDFHEHAKALMEVADAAVARIAYVHNEVQHA